MNSRTIACHLILLLFTASVSLGSADPNAYWKAAHAKILVAAMKQSTPPAAVKEALLNKTRPEDRAFVKSMIIFWKKNSEQTIQTEFDQIIMRDAEGREFFRMAPVEGEAGTFEVNGTVWQVPEKGSISQSLKKVLTKKSVSLFNLFSSSAFAAEDAQPALAAAFTYAFATEAGMLVASDHLKKYSPRANLLRTGPGSLAGKILDDLVGAPVPVQCTPEAATGRMNIAKQIVEFSVRKDGSVILRPYDTKIPFKVSSSTVQNRSGKSALDRDLKFSPCSNEECSETGAEKYSLRSFLKIPTPTAVDVALTFHPLDDMGVNYPIEYACEDESDCENVEIRDFDKLSARDKKWAVKYRNEANVAMARARSENAAVIRAIRPLYECCQDGACRADVFESGVKLVPAPAGSNRATTL